MKLEDVSMQELIDQPLFWEDFDLDRKNKESVKAFIERDPKAVEKIRFLDQVEDGNLLDRNTFFKLDFYEVEFTEYARLFLAEGEYPSDDSNSITDVDYPRDYSNIRLLIQDVTGPYPTDGQGMFAIYLKDYLFGFITPVGMCVYPYNFDEDSWEQYKNDPANFIKEHVLLELETQFWEDDFDLKQELYDYYHNLPDVHNPLLEKQTDLDRLISVKETSEILGVSVPRVMKMIKEKSIDGYRFGGKLLVTKSSIDNRIEYIKEHGKPKRGKAPEGKRKKKK
ncbi:helix-turn-helix domain-containing protein [Adlercreutzia sp. ZJ304]|uniref:helix-turn-helix domain-containing protein n=1 Tax=Adlercreutzia sp. ZJ304 TaxID=2709791 RepID=UPI0013E9BF68|nr:helix-turn-helix domain-containing protein [Adlercreutzia sp. ZJ304]